MVWKADIIDGRVRLQASFNRKALPLLRDIQGGRWHDEDAAAKKYGKHRSFPIHWQTCIGLRKAADAAEQKLQIGENLWKWASEEKARQDTIPDVKSLDEVELVNLPKVNPKLFAAAQSRPFQTVGIAFGARNKQILIADEPGLGKTLQAIGAFQESMTTGPILVVAPKSAAAITWPHELERWSNGDKYGVIGAHLSASERVQALRYVESYCAKHPDERFWVITNVEYLRIKVQLNDYGNYAYEKGRKIIYPVAFALLEFFDIIWSGLVVDESHKYLAGSTGNKKKWSAQRLGLGAIDVAPNGIRMALSGTPMRGKKENLWGTLNFLRPELYTSYWKWIGRHFKEYEDPYGGTVTTDELKDKSEFYSEAAQVMIRRNKAQVVQDLPPKMYAGWPLDPEDPDSPVAVWLEMSPQQKKQYQEIIKMAATELKGGLLLTHGILSEITRLKQFANAPHIMNGGKPQPIPDGSNKVQWIVNWLEERGMLDEDPGKDIGKVIIASQFTSWLDEFSIYLLHGLGKHIQHHKLTGATGEARRRQMQKEFQEEGGPRIFLLNTAAGGVSLTLDAADDVIIVDQTTVPDDQEQVEDRAHRISRPDHQVTIWRLASLGSIEEAIARTTDSRESDVKSIIDNERGVEFMKKLLNGVN